MARKLYSRHLAELVEEVAVDTPDHLAVISGSVALTYGELNDRSTRMAVGLRRLGVGPGSTVGLLCTNRWEWLVAALGAFRCGARVAAFNTFAKVWDLEYMLDHSQVEVLVILDRFRKRDYIDTLRQIVDGSEAGHWRSTRFPALRDVVAIGDRVDGAIAFEELLEPSAEVPLPKVSAFDASFVLYTSGSTARPKAVPLRHYAQIENGFEIGERLGFGEAERVWVPVPLFWAYGATNALPATLTHRGCLVLQEAFNAAEALELIGQHRCTVGYTLPNITSALLRTPGFSSDLMRTMKKGATIGSPADLEAAATGLGVTQVSNIYGSTETYGNCCVTPHDWPLSRKLGCQGPPLPRVELRVVEPETNLELPAKKEGEILVRGYVVDGYWKADAAENRAFGDDGWYRTGDLGWLDDDRALHFTERATDMIKVGGINVSPSEVEDYIRLHPDVAQTVVLGVPDPDMGQVIAAYVVPKPATGLGEEGLRTHCAGLASYKVPATFNVVETLPVTDTGKVARRLLRDGSTPNLPSVGGS